MNIDYLAFLQKLVRLPTQSGEIDAQWQVQNLCIDFVREHASRVKIYRGSDYSWTLLTRGSESNPLLFVCHTDTVPAEIPESWSSDPFDGAVNTEVGTLHGRGSVDMKGGLVAALMTLIQSDPRGDGVAVLLTADEEIGSRGAKVAAEELPPFDPRLIIIPEATDNCISRGHRGALWVKVGAKGVAAHGSRPHTGVNAITTLSREVINRLEDFPAGYDDYLGRETVNLGMFSGGSAPNIVPDQAELILDFRTVGPPDHILSWLRGLHPDVQVTEIINLRSICTAQSLPVLQDYPEDPAAPYFTDGSVLKEYFPDAPIIIWGPGDPGMMHAVDETLDLASLDLAIRNFGAVASYRNASVR